MAHGGSPCRLQGLCFSPTPTHGAHVLRSLSEKPERVSRLVEHCAKVFGTLEGDALVVLDSSKVGRTNNTVSKTHNYQQIARHCALQLLRAQSQWPWPAFEAEWRALLPAVRCGVQGAT